MKLVKGAEMVGPGVDPRFLSSESASIEVFQQIINGLPEQIALLDTDWNILAVNDPWAKTASLYGYRDLRLGTNYRAFCQAGAAEGHSPAVVVSAGIEEMDAGTRDSYRFTYHGSGRWEGFAFQLVVTRMQIAGRSFITVTRYDVTELVLLRGLREGFSDSLIESQDAGRRRLAREVHDSTMQQLVAISFSLGQLRRAAGSEATGNIVAEMDELLTQAQRELRSISFLAHPPSLEDLGLAEALRGLVDGFSRRTDLKVSLVLEGDCNFGWRGAQVAVYRMVQEALSNVHRHARATHVGVGLFCRKGMIHAVVVDDGIGMPGHVPPGVGLSGMRERFDELGGRLTVRRASKGCTLFASLPSNPRIRAVGDLANHA